MTRTSEALSSGVRDEAANFNRLARLYRWMEWLTFGPWLARCRCAFLADMSHAQRALVLGDGDGRFTAALLAANQNIQVEAVDASAAMLRALQRSAGPNAWRVRTCRADARLWAPGAYAYDLIATHFFLDCLTTDEVRDLAQRISLSLRKDAVWLISEFAVPQGAYGSFVARPLIAFLYSAFGVLTGLRVRRLPDHRAALEQAGFALRERQTRLGGLLTAEKWMRRQG